METAGGFTTLGASAGQMKQRTLAAVALGAVATIKAAFTDNGKFHRWYAAAAIWSSNTAQKITVTLTGVAADVKAVQVIIIGTDANDAPLTESLPAFTLDTLGSVTSVGSFKTITSIEFPFHDGLGVIHTVTAADGSTVLAAYTGLAVNSVFQTATITQPAVSRNVTATAGGVNTDIKAISPTVRGTNDFGAAISETLPAFTVDTAGTVTGNKAFKSITTIDLPAHDGTGATTSFGTGAKLGLGDTAPRNTVFSAYLNDVREATAPTVVNSASAVESNTFQLNSALNGSDVTLYYLSDRSA